MYVFAVAKSIHVNSKQALPNILDLSCSRDIKCTQIFYSLINVCRFCILNTLELTCKKLMLSHVLTKKVGMRYPKEEKIVKNIFIKR